MSGFSNFSAYRAPAHVSMPSGSNKPVQISMYAHSQGSAIDHGPFTGFPRAPVSMTPLSSSKQYNGNNRSMVVYGMDAFRGLSAADAYAQITEETLKEHKIEMMGIDAILQHCIETCAPVPVPWPQRPPIHSTSSHHILKLSVEAGSERDSLHSFLSSKQVVGKFHTDDAGPRQAIAFKFDSSVLKKWVPKASVPDERWNVNPFHILPTAISITSVDSNLPGTWQVVLSSGSKHFTEESVVTSQTGSSRIQFSSFRSTPVGGLSDPILLFHQNQQTTRDPEFRRWLNVDFKALRDQVNKSRDPNLNQFCVFKMPGDWSELYDNNILDLQYLVLTELHSIRNMQHQKMMQTSSSALHDEYDFNKSCVRDDKLVLRADVIQELIDEKEKLYSQTNHCMRLDDLVLYIMPAEESSWDPILKTCEPIQTKGPDGKVLSMKFDRVRFRMNLSICYEALTDTMKKDM